MKASETNFQPIIEGTKQYIIPLFQRPYSWQKKQWEMLWDDLISLCENEESHNHFIGSIVTMPTMTVPQSFSKYLLIDGQQRLTTIFVLLALLRDQAEIHDQSLSEQIQELMLVNKFKADNDYLKLLPTQLDRNTFQNIIKKEPFDDKTRLARCYNFFKSRLLREMRQTSDILQKMSMVINYRLSVVSIVLDPNDNPHLVFESLNAKGKTLTQADLIRNHFFMRIQVEQQEGINEKYWEPMQKNLGDNLTEFIRHYMMRYGTFVKQGDIYFELKKRVKDMDVLTELKKLAVFANYYQRILKPEHETDEKVRKYLTRLNRLEITTAYPFLLNCYYNYINGTLSRDQFVEILKLLENFIIRRLVCNIPSNQLNKIFPSLYEWSKESEPSNIVDGVRKVLQDRDYPNDADFKTRLVESRLYSRGERSAKVKLILESIEESYGHKETVNYDDLTIEHVMPQKLTDWWKHHLGKETEQDYEVYLHTLGNLTLTAYNSELSNSSFPEKQKKFAESHVEMNKYFSALPTWNYDAIFSRSEILADIALKIWPYFGKNQRVFRPTSGNKVTGKTPKTLILLGQRYEVKTWRSVLETTMTKLADLEPESMKELIVDFPSYINTDPSGMIRSTQLSNGLYIDLNVSAKRVYNFCNQAIEHLGLANDDWFVEVED
jgi:uncharacterized protein with ParB-like and HNH nuclease domain